MKKTPLEKYFGSNTSNLLRQKYFIKNMEQLLSIGMDPDNLIGFAQAIGLPEKEFNDILNLARKNIVIPAPSGKVYTLGACSL